VADGSNHRIQRFSAVGTFLGKWGRNGGTGAAGTGDGEFNIARGIAVSGAGQVYVTDVSNHRIQRFDAGEAFVNKWGRNGGDGTAGTGDGEFFDPFYVAVSGTGKVYVADLSNNRIQRFDAAGVYDTKWGGSGNGEFIAPTGVAVSGTGEIYVADFTNHRIQRFFDSEEWVLGTNTFVDDAVGPTSVAIGSGQILGTSLTLDSSKGLVVGDTTSIRADGTLHIDGGSLTTGTIEGDN